MPTEITQTEVPNSDVTILRVSGELLDGDAEILGRVVSSVREESGRKVVIDLSGLDFLDSEAASPLRRLEALDGVSIEGLDILLQSSIDLAERQAN